ncbi:hypothetical protein H9Y04_15955 [Streptomyces sp. TRM66268-LWL]|uniref:Uncharacterized protein n=1 Tax=Streptomyces polyasparticus TaxID=2767826 RepID=A0ABR7SGF7_9ACTN|nr:hypothetical protein [Streptomyces polyasparticus]MBC9714059.1 hypothetical protein [Streptomyces polyasparticus]
MTRFPAVSHDTRHPTAAADWVADVRDALAFHHGEQQPALLTLRDVLLDDAPRTPEQALAAARVLLAAHTRELSVLARQHTDDYRDEHGVNRGTRGLLTGMAHIRRQLDAHAITLDGEAGL